MAYRKRRAPNKGKSCSRYKRVRVRGGGVQRRCAKFSGARSAHKRSTKRRRTSKRRPAGMAKRGSKCVSFRRVRVRGGGVQKRCRKYRAR